MTAHATWGSIALVSLWGFFILILASAFRGGS